jgi:SAM-dependent methyltransferase
MEGRAQRGFPEGGAVSLIENAEKDWWNTYADLEGKIWTYNRFLSWVVRRGYLNQMEAFLYKPGGRLLDVGCGNGWVSLRFARKGMAVEGIDLSEAQIERACQRAEAEGLDKWAHFECVSTSDLSKDRQYDAVLVHATLHHLNHEQRCALLSDIVDLLRPHGRLYLYEPMAPLPAQSLLGRAVDKGMGEVLEELRCFARALHLTDDRVLAALRDGWTMRSPYEAPIRLAALKEELPSALKLRDVYYWHVFAVAYANFCMELKPLWQKVFSPAVLGFVGLDWLLLRLGSGEHLHSWPMAAIMVDKIDRSY